MGKTAGVGVGVGEKIVVAGISVDGNTGVGVTLETAVGVDIRTVDMDVAEGAN